MDENIDVVQRGIESKGIPFDSGRAQPQEAESDAPNVFERIDAPIKGTSDDELVRQSVKELNRQRDAGGSDDPFAEQRNLVDVELKYDGAIIGPRL
jgi:hypothetical protein